MVWKLLLTLAVLGLGICYSNGQVGIVCSTNSECKSVCGTCNKDASTGIGNCEAGTCDTVGGYVCNTSSGKCEKPCTTVGTGTTDCSYKNCDPEIPATCLNGFCESCPAGLNCVTKKCMCTVATCNKNCGEGITSCCSADASTCNCCSEGQICYRARDETAKSFSWGHRVLHMEKVLYSSSCQFPCDVSSQCVTDDCEQCLTDPNDSNNDPKRKVCMPCAAIKKCRNACCTASGCVCCDAGQTCVDKSCQCTDASCATVCGTCNGATCTSSCNGDQTCKKDPSGVGYSCQSP